MEWFAHNWPFVVFGALVILLLVRLVLGVIPWRRAPRHTGEQVIRVIGVGGGGGNAVNAMIDSDQAGVEYVTINTDGQVLERSKALRRVRIGDQVTKGLGAGGDATLGRRAAEEDTDALREAVAGADLVFVTAGMGGGTGSGATPIIAGLAREAGALTVGVVTMPFGFEGTARRRIAEVAVDELRPNVDTLLVVENERVTSLSADDTTLADAFHAVNDVLGQTIRSVVDIMSTPGLINLDFADVRAIMRNGGPGLAGIGQASGPDRARQAAAKAISSPLLALDVRGALAILLHVAGSSKLALHEVITAAEIVRETADEDANIIFGATFDDHLRDEIRVTVVATHFPALAGVPLMTRSGSARGLPDRAPLQTGMDSVSPVAAAEPVPAVEPVPAADSGATRAGPSRRRPPRA